jgi:hypothetical protein
MTKRRVHKKKDTHLQLLQNLGPFSPFGVRKWAISSTFVDWLLIKSIECSDFAGWTWRCAATIVKGK